MSLKRRVFVHSFDVHQDISERHGPSARRCWLAKVFGDFIIDCDDFVIVRLVARVNVAATENNLASIIVHRRPSYWTAAPLEKTVAERLQKTRPFVESASAAML
jgi:hypothetical protein